MTVETRPTRVLFLCVHNAGRSQMAAGWLRPLSTDQLPVDSAGSAPGAEVNPVAVEAMAEVGIDISGAEPQHWTDEMIGEVDVVVTMGCGDICPVYANKRYLDWELDDPAGCDLTTVRGVRDEIGRRVDALLADIQGADGYQRD